MTDIKENTMNKEEDVKVIKPNSKAFYKLMNEQVRAELAEMTAKAEKDAELIAELRGERDELDIEVHRLGSIIVKGEDAIKVKKSVIEDLETRNLQLSVEVDDLTDEVNTLKANGKTPVKKSTVYTADGKVGELFEFTDKEAIVPLALLVSRTPTHPYYASAMTKLAKEGKHPTQTAIKEILEKQTRLCHTEETFEKPKTKTGKSPPMIKEGDAPNQLHEKPCNVSNRCECSMGDFASNHTQCRKAGSKVMTDEKGKQRNICDVHLKQTYDHMSKFTEYKQCWGCNRSWYDNADWLTHYTKYKASKKATNPNYVKKTRNH